MNFFGLFYRRHPVVFNNLQDKQNRHHVTLFSHKQHACILLTSQHQKQTVNPRIYPYTFTTTNSRSRSLNYTEYLIFQSSHHCDTTLLIIQTPFDIKSCDQELKNIHSHRLLYQSTQEMERPRYPKSKLRTRKKQQNY